LPIAGNSIGGDTQPEIRLPNVDSRLRTLCDNVRATECYDNFWRIESVSPTEVVLRYRRVGFSEEQVHANPEYIARATLRTDDGRSVPGVIHQRFTVERLAPIPYQGTADAPTGRTVYRRQADGSVVQEAEMGTVFVERHYERYAGTSYIVFSGQDLIRPQSLYVELVVAKRGLFGREQVYRWSFDGSAPMNVTASLGPEVDRPDLAATGAVQRK